MWQTLLVLAFAASTFLIMPSEGTSRCQEPTTTSKPCSGGPTKPIRKCSKPNEVFDSCPAPCPPRECGVNKALILCAPAPKPGSADCKPGCRCADGYLRDKAGNCIPEKECPIKCPRNETLDPCLSLCPPRLCGVNIAAVSCLAQNPDDCKPGCRCKDGYLRNADGFCIHEDDCPQCTNPNEVYDICPAPCPPRRCDVDERVIRCAAPPKPGDPECQPGCRCADGYVRNDKGQCVTRDQCPKCTGSHEVFDSCPSSCPPQTCESIGKTYHCPKTPTKCPEGTCICEPGYYRNKIGECISEEDCLLECGTNEIISECPPFECRPLECSQVGFPVDCPEDRTKCPGKPACICDYGYVRNSAGKCIPINECPSCGGDPNAASGCGVNCGRHCSDLKNKEPVACITICYDNACDCKKGYVLDDNTKKCVLPKHCTPVCGRDEVYSDCVNGNCQPRSCSQLGYPIPCRKIDLSTCIKGCLCKDGYVRAENGTCIPKENCPSCGGDPNAVSGCGVNCGRHCSDKGKGPVACPAICNTNGCDCREGLVLDASTGKCIPPDQCVSCGGDYNAEPGCDKDYSRRCPGPKPDECKCYKDSCRCKDGFLYDPKVKKCVRPESCSPPCGDFEVLSPCSNGGCGPWTCSDVGFPTGCVKMDQKYCREGCICQEGYVRENGTCIPATECPSCGGDPNATPGCGINCGRLCSDYNKGPVACPDICLGNACDCKKGFVFDEITKKCVLPEECSPVCGKNEVYSDCINGGCQAKNCSQLGKPVPCVKPLKCQPGCLCADGYLRADDGTCVPKDQCPPKCTGLYEVYDPCPPVCPPQTCESIGKRYNCPFIPADNSSDNCHGACRCKPGYFRNKIGNCISEEDCKKCTGPNEFFSCGGACDNECANLSEQNQTNCPIINIVCNPKCYCEAEYARDANNICIPIDQCPKSQCCKNERLEQCPDWSCSLQSCKELGFPLHCPDLPSDSSAPCPGPPKCVCDYNYVRDEDGKCIPQKECPSCGGDPNAESGCGLNCGRLCSNYDKGPVPCPRICYPNACDCKDGYVYDENLKKCVRPKQCTPTCGNDEVYSECINGGCQAKNCSQLGKPVPCIKIDPKYCIKGCLCKEGYLRADNGICVPEDQCNQCNKPHEYYDACAPTCPPQTCESIGRQYNCPISPQYCKGACRCDKGYYRNKIGECISEKDCLKCKGPHEYFSCGGACDNVCSKLSYENQTNCPIINIKCNPMCYCEEGYARNDKNICVPINECPVLKCRPDERLEQCPASLCTPQTCSQLGFPIPCPALSGDTNTTCPGPPGCVCDNDYVRNEIGECIPKNECPSCGGDPNAQAGCGVHCGNLCSNYKSKPRFCPLICIVNSCDCKKGYVYDQNLKKCVVPCDCTPVCGINEVYDTCANGGCQKRNCSQVGQFKLCLDPIKCIGGCVCQEGYLRAENGSCIPENECPGGTIDKCNQQHEVYDPCPPICPPQTCESIGQKYSCPAMIDGKNCNGTCRCEKGYYRNKIGQCISEEDCLKCTGPNEYFSCGGACDNVCATLSEQNQTNCPIKNIKCNPMCYCEKGYARDDKNICVPIDQCPEKCTQQHEVYDPCPPICPPQTCESIGQKYFCPATIVGKNCKGACRCEKGYYRNKIGQCISEKDCLKCTGPNEYFSCGGACDNVCATLSERNQTNCPIKNIKCNPMCYCEKGYARDDKNICVLIDQCPVSCGGDPNAEPGCGVNCGRLCSNYKKKNVVCPLICYVDGCDCKDGYVYDSNLKKCVRPKDCTPVCGNNEVYVTCANGGCDKRNCSQLDQPALCIDPLTCIGGCVCQKGYLRTEDGTCVPEDQCPLQCTQPHEVLDPCPSSCPPQTCDTIGKVYPCPKLPPDSDKYCKPACRCEEGDYRNAKGECISKKDCLKCTGPYEYFSCGVACDNECATLHEQNQTHCPIINKKCNPKCYCYEGYARDDNNICIPIEQCGAACTGANEVFNSCPSTCPPQTCESLDRAYICPIEMGQEPPCQPGCICKDGYLRNKIGECITQDDCSSRCGPNERYEENPSKVCEPIDCTEVGFPMDCPPVKDPDCEDKPACICKHGYVRDKRGVCIPTSECPSCGGDPNAVSGCGINCGRHCSDYGQEVSCILVCYDNACDCRDGFVYDDIAKKCVRYEDCTPTNTTPSNVNVTEARARLDKGNIALTGEFLYQLVSSKPNDNSVASGLSVLIPLAQLDYFSVGKVFDQLSRVLNLKNKDEIKTVFPVLTKEYKNQSNVEFEVATKYYANIGYPLSNDFIKYSEEYFDAGGENIDFSESVQAADTINAWVSDRTRGKIVNLVSPDMLNADTRLALINAIYFKGNWIHQFNPNDTKTKDFYKSNGDTVPVKMMYQQNSFNYAENDNYQILQMFYKNDNFSFIAVLPTKTYSIKDTAETLKDAEAFQDMIGKLKYEKVQVSLPKMLIRTQLDIAEMLKKVNVTDMFLPNNGDIQGILNNTEPLYVSSAVQQAFISVDETGSEAAAATAFIGFTTTAVIANPPKIMIFNANHPFIYYILFNGIPLFCGSFAGSS